MSKTFNVLIKGTASQAAEAMTQRDIPYVYVIQVLNDAEHHRDECRAVIDSIHFEKVVAWFCEPGAAPFPVGTCLLYSTPAKEDAQ